MQIELFETKPVVRKIILALVFLGIVSVVSIGFQADFKDAFKALVLWMVVILLLPPFVWLFQRSEVVGLLSIVLSITGFFYFIGPAHLWLDLCCASGSILAVPLIAFLRRRRTGGTGLVLGWKTYVTPKTAVVSIIIFWLSISLADYLYPFRPYRAGANPAAVKAIVDRNTHLAIAFSGGGYRAGLFHAGIISVLDASGIRPQAISSVSGGSIFASFYAVGGTPDEFRELVQQHAFNLKRQLFDAQTLLHLVATTKVFGTRFTLLPIAEYTRTMAEADMLDRIFLDEKTFKSLRQDRPELMLCTTDLLGQRMMGFTGRGVIIQPISVAQERSHFSNPVKFDWGKPAPPQFSYYEDVGLSEDERLSRLVAASGAFPGAFKPYRILPSIASKHGLLLVDGGLGDNLGLTLASGAAELAQYSELARRKQLKGVMDSNEEEYGRWPLGNWRVGLVISSDGSELAPGTTPKSGIAEISRAIDVIYATTGGDASEGQIDPLVHDPSAILLSPRLFVPSIEKTDMTQEQAWSNAVDLWFGDEMVFAPDPPSVPGSPLAPPPRITFMKSFDLNVLSFMAKEMPRPQGERLTDLLSKLASNGTYVNGVWNHPHWTKGTPEREVYELVEQELFRCTKAFIRTSTLEDDVPKDDVQAIYLLGQYVALVDLPYIRYGISSVN